jgi:hypothetical protein
LRLLIDGRSLGASVYEGRDGKTNEISGERFARTPVCQKAAKLSVKLPFLLRRGVVT